ncbi:uncharacterized protein [Panulirus ornatus]|uniref:uncharacterized protein isoform X2 n=1 Tax=Panulirus ornatus TaxID=150431 RepID=UPI003A844811
MCRLYQFQCQCLANSSGEMCQWGGVCPDPTHTDVCFNHGQCQYQGGKNLCVCNEEYFGQHCEHHESTAPEHSKDCGGRLECSHLCHMAGGTPRCLCRVGYMLIDKTHCVSLDDLWDVTVRFHNSHENTSLKEKTYKFLHEKGLQDLNITVPPNSSGEMKVHFTVKDEEKDLLPREKVWEESFNSSVTITYQNVLWIGPLKKEVFQSNYLVLTCSVFGHLPLMFTWYKGQHRIYNHNVTSCSVPHVNKGKVTIMHDQETSKVCTVQLWVEGYNPLVDWGTYTCQITDDNHNTVSRTIVAELTHPLHIEVIPYVKTLKKNGNVSLSCSIKSDWDGGQHYEFSWMIEPKSGVGHYFHKNSLWNRSSIFIYNVKQSVNVTCRVIVKKDLCSSVVTESNDQTVIVHIIHPQDTYCPAEVSNSTTWQATLVGQSDENTCPEGFQGKAKRRCQIHQGHKPTWAVPDFSRCIYAPIIDILMNPKLILQERGYPVTLENVGVLARQLHLQLEKRNTVFLPGEYSVVLTILKRLLNPVNVPLPLDIFLAIMEQTIKKMHVPHTAAIWELFELIHLYIRSSLENHPPSSSSFYLGDMVGKLETLQPENVSSFSLDSPIQDQGVKSLKVEVPGRRDETKLYVGAVMYLHPEKLMEGATMQGRQSLEYFPVELANAPIVEVMAVNFVGKAPSPLGETLISHFSYMDYPARTEVLKEKNRKNFVWAWKCGGADFTNNTIVWNLSRCVAKDQNEKLGAYTCQCEGQGLFGLVMAPPKVTKPHPTEPDWEMTVVAGVCSGVVLLLILLCLMFLIPWSCVTSDEYSLNMKNVANNCLKRLRQSHSHTPQRDVEVEPCQADDSLELKSYKEYNFQPLKSVAVSHEPAQMGHFLHRTHQKSIGSRHVQDKIYESKNPAQAKSSAHECSGTIQRSCNPPSVTFKSRYRDTIGTLGSRSLVSPQPSTKSHHILPRNCINQRLTATVVGNDTAYLDMTQNIKQTCTKMMDNRKKCLKNMHRYVNVHGNSSASSIEFESSQYHPASSQKDETISAEFVASIATNPTPKVESKIKESQAERYLPMTVKISDIMEFKFKVQGKRNNHTGINTK